MAQKRTIHDLVTIFGASKRSVERRIEKFKKNHPEQYELWVTHGDNNMKFYSVEIIDALGMGIKVVPGEKLPPRKELVLDKTESATIIHIQEDTSDEKQRWAIFNQIVSQYSTGDKILSECCRDAEISVETFRRWTSFNPEMYKAYKEARMRFQENSFDEIKDIAIHQVRKSMQGYDRHLESISYQQKVGPNGEVISIPQSKKVTQKHILPNASLIMFALFNRDRENWVRNLPAALEGRKAENDPLDQLSEEQMREYLRKAEEMGLLDAGESEKIV